MSGWQESFGLINSAHTLGVSGLQQHTPQFPGADGGTIPFSTLFAQSKGEEHRSSLH
jgi:hypothetical protein